MGVVLLVAIIIGYGEYRRIDLVKQINLQNQKLSSTMAAFISDINGIQDKITSIVDQNNLLNSTVQTQIDQTSALSDQFSQVNDTAIALDKLSKVDTQLLQKYSKVYFLNENYKPSSISDIPGQYGYDKTVDYQILEGVEPFLDKMFEKASDAGIDLKVISAYRSFDDQSILKSTYNVIYGSGTANQFSADQGYSEHQLGTTIDITTPDTGDNFDLFDGTEAYKWLSDNAYRYGFILSYPKDNSYYTYEPWHWRFVGVDLATRLHREDKNFYDLDQRKINNYLGVFFD
jgi:D-alanyl-D-alanine carboxypeptidase